MNTLKKYNIDNSEIMIKNFRNYQYDMIPNFCDLFVEYLAQQSNNYIWITKKEIYEKLQYFGLNESQLLDVKIYIKTNDLEDEKIFLNISFPLLLKEQMFYLNGCYYSPAIYSVDLPIVIKKESVKLSSLFNSITIYFKHDIATFTGVNIPLSYFISLFVYDINVINLFRDIMKNFKYNFIHTPIEDIIIYFRNKFNFTGDTHEELINFLYKIFFDRYTYNMYNTYYNSTDLQDLISKAIISYANNEIQNFSDLNNKRLIFIEFLISPIIKRIADVARQVWSGYKHDEIKIDSLTIVKYFQRSKDDNKQQKGLSGNYLYDTANLYSGILHNKISMVPPGVENAPKSVQTIHPSHYGKICPISISSQKPGRVVSMVPTTKLDVFGKFI